MLGQDPTSAKILFSKGFIVIDIGLCVGMLPHLEGMGDANVVSCVSGVLRNWCRRPIDGEQRACHKRVAILYHVWSVPKVFELKNGGIKSMESRVIERALCIYS